MIAKVFQFRRKPQEVAPPPRKPLHPALRLQAEIARKTWQLTELRKLRDKVLVDETERQAIEAHIARLHRERLAIGVRIERLWHEHSPLDLSEII